MKKGVLGVTDSGIPYDRTDGLEVRLTVSEIRELLRACVTALDAEPSGPADNDSDVSEAFEVAACKLADAAGIEPWQGVESWTDFWDKKGDADAAETLACDRDLD